MAEVQAGLPFGGARMPRLRIVPTVLFALLLVFAFGSAMPVPAGGAAVLMQVVPMVVLAAIGMACGAFIALFAPTAALIVTIPLSVTAAFFLGGDWLAAAWTLLLFAPILALRRLLAAQTAATPLLCRLAVLCGVIWLPEVYLSLGRAWDVWLPGAMIDRMMAELTALLQAVEIPAGGSTMGYTAEQAGEVAQLFVLLLPGLILLISCALAWLSWSLTLLLFRLHGLGGLIPPAARRLTMSRMGAVVFLAAALASMFGGGSLKMLEALALNLVLLLEPPLALIGLGAVTDYFRSRETVNGMVLALLILMLLTCNLSIVLLIVACIGVVRVFRGARAQ
ncbi:MAG: DUF2232 domain-containing protein [Clostridia bacterium]|nr:DUF2232 domain-containing protein [Clostridia bacterium]